MVESQTHKDKVVDIASWIRDAFGEEDGLQSHYKAYANDFLKFMTANGWDIIPYDERNHRYYPR